MRFAVHWKNKTFRKFEKQAIRKRRNPQNTSPNQAIRNFFELPKV